MEEKVGSFIQDANGNLVPNHNDEAMAERDGIKRQTTEPSSAEVMTDETK